MTRNDSPGVLEARSACVLSFRWDTTAPGGLEGVLDALVRLPAPPGEQDPEPEPRWLAQPDLPDVLKGGPAFRDLSPTIRAALAGSPGPRWLALGDVARARLFRRPRLGREGGRAWLAVDLRADLVVHAQGTALLVLSFGWGADDDGPLTLDDLVEAVFLARVAEADWRAPGWRLGEARVLGPRADLAAVEQARARRARFDPRVAASLEGEPIGLDDLARALVPESTGLVLARRHAVVHSAVVLDAAPASDALRDAAWRLRRGYDATYLPPPDPTRDDVVLQPRANRLIGISRDGAASLSWTSPARGGYERESWAARFTRLYLLLHLHVLAERGALSALAAEVQGRVGEVGASRDPESARAARDALTGSVERLVQYSVAVSTEECGGLADHEAFYRALRTVHGIREQRAELRAEVAEVFGLVEARYREAEEASRRRAEARARAVEVASAELGEVEQRRTARLERLVGVAGTLALVFSTVSGLLGMNIAGAGGVELWTLPAFWAVVGVAVAAAAGVAGVVWLVLRPGRDERAIVARATALLADPRGDGSP